MQPRTKIGFRPGLLDERPHRFDLVLLEPGVALIDKPAGLPSSDRLCEKTTPNLSGAINRQAREGKPELQRLGFSGCTVLYELDREMSGWVFAVGNPARLGPWREHHGSGLLSFEVLMITSRRPDLPDQVNCDLPVTAPTAEQRATVSHRKGKRTATRFDRMAVAGDFECWRATTRLWRPQALRMHAAETDLPILGDSLSKRRPTYSLEAYRRKQAPRRDFAPPFFRGLHAHLFRVSWTTEPQDAPSSAVCLPPGRLAVVFQSLFGRSFFKQFAEG